jgi:predicted PurR-regulated permease PerM
VRGWPMGEQLLGESEDRQGDNGDDNQDENGDDDNEGGLGETMVGDAGGIIFQVGTTIVSVFSTLILIFGTGIFFAINPDIYKKGIALLFTEKRADRVNEALETSGKALWQWLTGQFMAMAFVGITATIGLMIIGVPLALILGIIAGLSDFVPIVGPLAASILAILLAFSISPETALYTAILYLVIQQFESNLVTPLVQRRMVHIPPAVVILSLVAFGSVFGIAGVILATPLTVVLMVFVGMFYVQDVLGKEVTVPGKD